MDLCSWELALRGVFAGNLFDLGAAASAALYAEGGSSSAGAFATTRGSLLPRPWVVDDLDEAVQRLSARRYTSTALFVDNAGSDIVLGMLPLARELLRSGAKASGPLWQPSVSWVPSFVLWHAWLCSTPQDIGKTSPIPPLQSAFHHKGEKEPRRNSRR